MPQPSTTPLVSVIINTCNDAHFLPAAVDSVYAQTYQCFEIILYDNASTDNTREVAARYDARLRYFRSPRKLSLAKARNNALELARGEYVCLLDSDDQFMPLKLELQLTQFTGDVGMVYSNALIYHAALGKEVIWYKKPQSEGMIFEELLRNYHIVINTVLFKREIIGNDRRYWMNESFNQIEELNLFLRIAYKAPVKYVHEPLARVVKHDRNRSDSQLALIAEEWAQLLEVFAREIPDFQSRYATALRSVRATIFRFDALALWQQRRRGAAISRFINSLWQQFRPVVVFETGAAVIMSFRAFNSFKAHLRKFTA